MSLALQRPKQFSEVYTAHSRRVYGAALAVVRDPTMAEDVVQDVFMRLWCKPERFDPRRGDLGVYLRVMARSRAIDLIREDGARSRAGERLERRVERDEDRLGPGPEELVAQDQEGQRVRLAVRGLREGQRRALGLRYWGGLSCEEVARAMDSPLGTAKSRVRLGLENLRDAYSSPQTTT